MSEKKSSPCKYCFELIPIGKMICPFCKKAMQAPVMAGENCLEEDNSVILSDVSRTPKFRLQTGPWDYVWGKTGDTYGIVKTSTTLLAGSPGAGKSTLLLQMLSACTSDDLDPLELPIYIQTEEASTEILDRAIRLEVSQRIRIVPALEGANVGFILGKYKPRFVALDSLQGLVGNDDAMQEQICKICKAHAVRLNCPIIIISHVTKEEVMAGKMTLQHVVDTTVQFFPEDNDEFEEGDIRILSPMKNRNGPSNVESIFDMTEKGLVWVVNRKADGSFESNENEDEEEE